MPRIQAPTVAEHRSRVRTSLIDAAEEILRDGTKELTAGAVSVRAGIARNSIYRYVDSVDDLRTLVVERYLPAWYAAVERHMNAASDDRGRVVGWVEANLIESAETGHGWLMAAARSLPAGSTLDAAAEAAHTGMRSSLVAAWTRLLADRPDDVATAVSLTAGLLNAGFRELEAGRPVDRVVTLSGRATDGLVRALTD